MAAGRRALITAVISVSILTGIVLAGSAARASAGRSATPVMALAGIEATTPPAALVSTDTHGRGATSTRLSILVLAVLVGRASRPRRRSIPPTATRVSLAWKAGAASVRGPPVTLL
ncbi:MAG: hypothetical protein QOF30_1929 [Acidimicrobiaceae bacterium]|jgi:hypothetical protein|nr:hypothetical protein [Acidimicrobiaceae bacterium]